MVVFGIDDARDLTSVFFDIADEQLADGVRGDAFPDSTVLRLNLAVSVQYFAAVSALGEAETALGALSLLRGLIEAWAHLYLCA
jgi:hypothetical protein